MGSVVVVDMVVLDAKRSCNRGAFAMPAWAVEIESEEEGYAPIMNDADSRRPVMGREETNAIL
jgi:hypothetical protein